MEEVQSHKKPSACPLGDYCWVDASYLLSATPVNQLAFIKLLCAMWQALHQMLPHDRIVLPHKISIFTLYLPSDHHFISPVWSFHICKIRKMTWREGGKEEVWCSRKTARFRVQGSGYKFCVTLAKSFPTLWLQFPHLLNEGIGPAVPITVFAINGLVNQPWFINDELIIPDCAVLLAKWSFEGVILLIITALIADTYRRTTN